MRNEQQPNIARRGLFASALVGVSAWLAGKAPVDAAPATPDRAKVVYHLSDLDKVNFVLGNIRNHFEGMGGPDKVTIALVVHGPALRAFRMSSASPDVSKRVDAFAKDGLALTACGHTLKTQGMTLKDLLPGFVEAEAGGVVRIAELQSQGYVYLRP
jgi:intracellular sulfur oxidation DsrE/DsrF family protein